MFQGLSPFHIIKLHIPPPNKPRRLPETLRFSTRQTERGVLCPRLHPCHDSQNRVYRPISEQDTQAGYVDIFLCPLLEIYSDMKHSYIVELKYAKYKDSESRVEELRQEAITQANRYANTETVRNAIGNTILHKIVVVYKGMDMPVCEEV